MVGGTLVCVGVPRLGATAPAGPVAATAAQGPEAQLHLGQRAENDDADPAGGVGDVKWMRSTPHHRIDRGGGPLAVAETR